MRFTVYEIRGVFRSGFNHSAAIGDVVVQCKISKFD
jgi:hypothetical protein